jgi:hypothetical protein
MNMVSKNRHIGGSNPPPQPDQTFTATPFIILFSGHEFAALEDGLQFGDFHCLVHEN